MDWLIDPFPYKCSLDGSLDITWLQGPKFRVGELEGEPVLLKEGEIVEFGICKERWDDEMLHS